MSQSTVALVVWAMLGAGSADDGVRLAGRWFEEPVRGAVHRASRLLDEPTCAAILDDLRDGAGRALRERLEEMDVDAPSYARMVLFYDGSNDPPCRRPRTYAFTAAGSRIVRACPALGWLASSEPTRAAAVVIHEVLHTLGLGATPPASDEITALVEKRCRPH